MNYWIFQTNPKIFRLQDALRVGAVETFSVTAHKKKITAGDKIILWEAGKQAGVYGLATVLAQPTAGEPLPEELPFFIHPIEPTERVPIEIDYNLWSRPVTKNMLPDGGSFKEFYAGLPGTNFKATAKQYQEIVSLIEQNDLVAEPQAEYRVIPKIQHPLNQVFYGPPGTGKTYRAISQAVAIIEKRPLAEVEIEERSAIRARFEEYVQMGRVFFLTFHQSFAYEDFVEGIKPVVQNGQVLYGVEDGIFKQICHEARRLLLQEVIAQMPQEEQMIEFNQLYAAYLKYLKGEDFSHFNAPNNNRFFLHRVLPFGNLALRRAKSFNTQKINRTQLRKLYQQLPQVPAADSFDPPIRAVLGTVNTHAYWSVFNHFKQFENVLSQAIATEIPPAAETLPEIDLPILNNCELNNCEKCVLIIDEINRGNIPAIFGELISLIESDKREGQKEMLTAILPYSKMMFSVPLNLHLVATMNTADRSVEALDIALRRRFHFYEMPPDAGLIKKLAKEPFVAGVDLEQLLISINQRVEVLLDANYKIGHAYFLNVNSLKDLQGIFHNKIIPLLQEYFFGDYGKIGLVLGQEFVIEKNIPTTGVFANFNHDFAAELAEKRVYEMVDVFELTEGAFIRVYDKRYR
ncbi:MAG: McrB family protein [Saprospiraceae bacterium]